MRYRRLHTLGFAVLLVALTAIHCIPTETRADRRRSTTFLAASSQDFWPEWDGVTAHPELTDAHPTTGWPREYGRICVTFTSGASGEHRAIIDGRTDGEDPRPYLSVVNDGRIRFGIQTVGSIAGGEVIPFHTHTACVDRSYGPTTSLYLDGQLIGTSTTLPAWDWHPTARLGSRYGGADPLGGEIKSIQWRGFRLACDMRSDTCSDGRKITTQRATPVPCETSPGVWEMVGVNEGCYGVRGLESWAQNTSYLSWGAELDRSPWVGAAVPASQGYQITGPLSQSMAAVEVAEQRTTAWILRADTPRLVTIGVQPTGGCEVEVGTEWRTYSCTEQVAIGVSPEARITQPVGQSVYGIAAWHTRSATPGRACWGGEAPVTCARDFHRMSATGFPATTGEISWVMSLERMPDGGAALRGIVWADGAAVPNRISLTGGGGIRVYTGETAYITGPLSWEPGRSYTFRLIMAEDEWKVVRDGALVGSTPPLGSMDWGATVRLGDLLDGSISSLTVRSYEEVSP